VHNGFFGADALRVVNQQHFRHQVEARIANQPLIRVVHVLAPVLGLVVYQVLFEVARQSYVLEFVHKGVHVLGANHFRDLY